MDEGEERTTEELVAAFRERKKAQVQAARGLAATPAGPAPPSTTSPSPPSTLSTPAAPSTAPTQGVSAAPPAPPVPPVPSVASVPSLPLPASPSPPAPAPSPGPLALQPAAPSQPRAVAEIRPGTPPGSPLTVQSLRLSDRLLADRRIAVRGLRPGRLAGAGVLLGGLALLLLERYLATRAGATGPVVVAGVPLLALSVTLALAGALLLAVFSFFPLRPSLPVRLAASQQEEWDRLQAEMQALGWRLPVAWALVALGVLAAAVAMTLWKGLPASRYGAGFGLALALAGIVLLVHTTAKRAALHRLYVQTLVLSSLERTGLGPQQARDERVGPVLQALDQLLGALPESTVRRFLATPEAERYLELMDELAQERKDG